jgi:hypothetical protein
MRKIPYKISACDREERPQCLLYLKTLAAKNMQPNKLRRHFETEHSACIGKTLEYSHRKLTLISKTSIFKNKNCYNKTVACTIQSCLQN